MCVLSRRAGALCKPSGVPFVCVCYSESVCWVIIEAIVCIWFQPHISFGAPLRGASNITTFNLQVPRNRYRYRLQVFSSSTSTLQGCFCYMHRQWCMVIVGPWGCESHLRTEPPLRLQKLGWEKHVMFIGGAKLKHNDNLCIAFCEGRCEVFWSWLVPKVEADQFNGLGIGAIPQAPHLVIA